MRRYIQDNAVLCNEVNDKVVQHFVQCIETHGKHVQVSFSKQKKLMHTPRAPSVMLAPGPAICLAVSDLLDLPSALSHPGRILGKMLPRIVSLVPESLDT